MKSRAIKYIIGSSEQLKADIKSNPHQIVEKDFGLIGGKVFFVKPMDLNVTTELINQLDNQEDGRRPSSLVNYFVGGPFLLARTDNDAIKHHHLFNLSLSRPKDYARLALQELSNYLNNRTTTNLKDITVIPIRNALAKGLFDLEKVTPALEKALQAFSSIAEEGTDEFNTNVFLAIAGTYSHELLKLNPSYRASREQYIKTAEEFVNASANNVLLDLKSYAIGTMIKNLLSRSVIEVIKEKNQSLAQDPVALSDYLLSLDSDKLHPYLHDAYIQTLPASIVAGDNLMVLISCALSALATDSGLMQQLRDALVNLKLNVEVNANPEQLITLLDEDKKQSGFIHRLFLESARRESLQKSPDHLAFETVLWRYTSKPININGTIIPAKALIGFLNAMPRFDEKLWQDPAKFNPARFFNNQALETYPSTIFSLGKRACPAQRISEYIFKVTVAYIAQHYDLTLQAQAQEIHQQKINLQLRPLPDHSHENVNAIQPTALRM